MLIAVYLLNSLDAYVFIYLIVVKSMCTSYHNKTLQQKYQRRNFPGNLHQ